MSIKHPHPQPRLPASWGSDPRSVSGRWRGYPARSASANWSARSTGASLENIVAANDRVVAAMERMELPQIYRRSREALHTSSDGQKFEVRRPSLNASHSFKYFGQMQGVSAYTFIVSNAVKPQPSASLIEWMSCQRDDDLFVASLTIAEIRGGILELPDGRRRDALEARFTGNEGPQSLFAGRILSLDDSAGLIWARSMAAGKAAGRPRSALDMILAAVAEANDCMMVTDDERDFWGLQFFNPLRSQAGMEEQ
ncbi:MAG: Tn3 family transposase [Boseongicola sp. SB0677_bin_26]|nr:Tn3 family transposase [Boseongicola sp. SB0665_bin_10]MYG27688.1 Tn3 family transposase [Boseongicola sp. SB0677_bin_26]